MALNGSQFNFYAERNSYAGKTTVAAYDKWDDDEWDSRSEYSHPDDAPKPLAVVEITHGSHTSVGHQRAINAAAARGREFPVHSEGEVGEERTPETIRANAGQIPGQRHWKGGVFEPAGPDYISWLHAAPGGGTAALKPMLGIAVDTHGSVPAADAQLSPDGSRISRSLSRKLGVSGHPDNPSMGATLGPIDPRGAAEISEYSAAGARERVSRQGVARGTQVANAMAARGPAAEARQASRERLQAGQFSQLQLPF